MCGTNVANDRQVLSLVSELEMASEVATFVDDLPCRWLVHWRRKLSGRTKTGLRRKRGKKVTQGHEEETGESTRIDSD